MLKNKFRIVIERDVTFTMLFTLLGLLYKHNGWRGFPIGWLNGKDADFGKFFISFILILLCIIAIDVIALIKERPPQIPQQQIVKPNVVQPTTQVSQIPTSTTKPSLKIPSQSFKPTIRTNQNGRKSNKGLAIFAIIFILFMIQSIPFGLLSDITSELTDDDTTTTTSLSASEQVACETIKKIANNENIGFDITEIKDIIDWSQVSSDLEANQPITYASEQSDTNELVTVYSDEGRIVLNIKGSNLSDKDSIKVVGIYVEPYDDNFEYLEGHQAGDCEYEYGTLADY